MFEHMFMPLSKHPDEGFGAVGRSFKEAADQLREHCCEGGAQWMNGHLPINYLYRHAIELQLKSAIIIAHRKLRLVDNTGAYDPIPKLIVGKTVKQLYNVHGIQALFSEMMRIFVTHRDLIAKFSKTEWWNIPKELEDWVAIIEKADPGSTVFRYPISNTSAVDIQKSSFKKAETTELLAKMNSDGPKQFAFMVVNDNNEIVESFALDDKPLPELREALLKAVDFLHGVQLGVLVEFRLT
jgi:hypothetical protein